MTRVSTLRELLAKGARVLAPPVSHPWGLRDFRVTDIDVTGDN